MLATFSGRSTISLSMLLRVDSSISPLTCAAYMERIYIQINCVLYALVVATAISGPAKVYITWSASLAILEPTTLTIANVFTPISFVRRSAARLSAVSPDCEIMTTNVSWESFGLR